jgi:hypothetical protein
LPERCPHREEVVRRHRRDHRGDHTDEPKHAAFRTALESAVTVCVTPVSGHLAFVLVPRDSPS